MTTVDARRADQQQELTIHSVVGRRSSTLRFIFHSVHHMCRVLRLRYSVVAGCAFVVASAGLAASGGVPSVDPNDRIVYNLSRSDGASWLAVSNLDGTSLTTLMPPLRKRGSIEPSAVAWSPRGQQLAFVAESDRSVLYALDVRRKRVRPLVDLRHRQLGAGDTPFVWSPDGTRIAFAWSRGPACTRRRADVGVSIVDVRSRRIRELNALAPIQDAALRKHLFDVVRSSDAPAGLHRACRPSNDLEHELAIRRHSGARAV